MSVCGCINVLFPTEISNYNCLCWWSKERPILLGRNWLHKLKLDCSQFSQLYRHTTLNALGEILKCHLNVFWDELSMLKDIKVFKDHS